MKKNKNILTKNRLVTVDKRETSFQGFSENFENQQSGIYNFIIENDKNKILTPKIEITEKDIQQIPPLAQLKQSIAALEKRRDSASGKRKALLTKHLIQMRKDQYIIKNTYKPPIMATKVTKNYHNKNLDLEDKISINERGQPQSKGLISLLNPIHVSCLLCNYSNIKKELHNKVESDFYYLMEDLDKLLDSTLVGDAAILLDLVKLKFQQKTSKEIAAALKDKYGHTYSTEYISILWRKKIPKLLSDKAKQNWLIWHYTFEEKGKWKKCSKCKEVKLAHPYFFTINKTSKDGWYSICKCCRNKKNKKEG